ncbi:MAG: Fic/DOC family N-terminal domain-containing protein [Erythrobacter sp.]
MPKSLQDYDFDSAVRYHQGQFPPANVDYARLAYQLGSARQAIARYDIKLERLHNEELMLAPLRNTEAVVSSRMEGTIATLDEVLRIQADQDDDGDEQADVSYRQEAIEVFSYTRAVKNAQRMMSDDKAINSAVIRKAHSSLLFMGQGGDKTPGRFKEEQNYVVDRRSCKVLFVPISADDLGDGISAFEDYLHDDSLEPLVQTAIAHAEFEALHPFKDGNGRIGRMLVPLNLWSRGVIHAPHFYVSPAIEERREEYIENLRAVSENANWTDWVSFFLEIVERQAEMNIEITDKITNLYDEMQDRFRSVLRSRWAPVALDYIFAKPVFRNAAFTNAAGIPSQTAHRMNKLLVDNGLLNVIEPASGRRAALLAFRPLLEVVR